METAGTLEILGKTPTGRAALALLKVLSAASTVDHLT
jgi:hypothetical protein